MRYANRPILGLQSRKQREENVAAALPAPLALPDYLTPQQREQVLNKLFSPYGRQINERLIDVHTALQKLEKRAARIQMMRGEIPLDMQDQRKQLREQMSTLQAQVETYLDLLDSELAPLPAIQDAEDELFNLVSLASGDEDAVAAMGEAELGPWDDVETKHFYEQLLDLTIVVPPVLLQEGQEKEKARIRREKEKAAGGGEGGDDGEEEEEKSSSSSSSAPRSNKALVDDAETWKPNWEMTIDELEAKLASMQARTATLIGSTIRCTRKTRTATRSCPTPSSARRSAVIPWSCCSPLWRTHSIARAWMPSQKSSATSTPKTTA
jgi:hypothetical protein